MALTLTTHDTGFADPDEPTIAQVLASLDGRHRALATLGRSEFAYVQASGSVDDGFAVEYQEGSLDQRYRSRPAALPLARTTEMFLKYARGDSSWRDGLEWEHIPFALPQTHWSGTWVGFAILLGLVIAAIWYLRR
jgi:hypothetical protein